MAENPIIASTEVEVDRIFLDRENPRHDLFDNETEVIQYLCKNEDIYPLAKDIVENGLNPLERFALIPARPNEQTLQPSYIVAEGNRRICALKVLNDPQLAPKGQRNNFKKLQEDNEWDFSTIPAIIFRNRDDINLWLDRIHSGEQGGIGRKAWDAEQKTRFSGTINKLAQLLLDHAENKGYISKKARARKLTTVQRYLDNNSFRGILSIDNTNLEFLTYTKPEKYFNLLLAKFINDLLSNKVNSRTTKIDINEYSQELASVLELTEPATSPEPEPATSPEPEPATSPEPEPATSPEPEPATSPEPDNQSSKKIKPPSISPKQKKINFEDEIFLGLQSLGGIKLPSLYFSICTLNLRDHTPLITIGVWAFFESLTALAGKKSEDSFLSYLNKNKLYDYGITDRPARNAIFNILERIQDWGNITKHNDISANFIGDQLANDMDRLKNVILKCIEEIKTKNP